VDRLAEAVSALGLKGKAAIDGPRLDRFFRARNRIVHEMDMDLTNPARRQVSRTRGDMISATDALTPSGRATPSQATNLHGSSDRRAQRRCGLTRLVKAYAAKQVRKTGVVAHRIKEGVHSKKLQNV